MACQRCGSSRIAKVGAKCNDCFNVTVGSTVDYQGYVPGDFGIGSMDYIDFDYCMDCGQIQGTFPLGITDQEHEAVNKEEKVEEEDFPTYKYQYKL